MSIAAFDDQATRERLTRRLAPCKLGRWGVVTTLRHFALIQYALPAERLRPLIPTDRFEIEEFCIGGRRLALLSVVPFLDHDFHMPNAMPWKMSFAQTNHRVYIRDRRTGEPSVWFLGTTLGSPLVHLPRLVWKMPWHRAHYLVDCRYDAGQKRYAHWEMRAESDWAAHDFRLVDSGESVREYEGFSSRADFLLRLTHPIAGYFRRTDGAVGCYEIRHPLMKGLKVARVEKAWCSLYERVGILSREEMSHPHSAFVLPRIRFQVCLPPRTVPFP